MEDRYRILKEMKTEDRDEVYDFAKKRSEEIKKGVDEPTKNPEENKFTTEKLDMK